MNFARFMPVQKEVSRRDFLKVSSLAGAGFAIGGISLPLSAAEAEVKKAGFGHFVKISDDNLVTVVIKHLDKIKARGDHWAYRDCRRRAGRQIGNRCVGSLPLRMLLVTTTSFGAGARNRWLNGGC